MGVHPTTGGFKQYWNKCEDKPISRLSKYIARQRYEELTRYFKVNHPKEELIDDD